MSCRCVLVISAPQPCSNSAATSRARLLARVRRSRCATVISRALGLRFVAGLTTVSVYISILTGPIFDARFEHFPASVAVPAAFDRFRIAAGHLSGTTWAFRSKTSRYWPFSASDPLILNQFRAKTARFGYAEK